MISKVLSALLGLSFLLGPMATALEAQRGPPPPVLAQAVRQALNVRGVYSSQGMSRDEGYFMLVRGPRSCAETDQLWQELKALVPELIIAFPGDCRPVEFDPDTRLTTPMGSVLNLNVVGTYDAADLQEVTELAWTIQGWLTAEMWSNGNDVLAPYRAAGFNCNQAGVANQMQALNDSLDAHGNPADVVFAPRWCYGNLTGPRHSDRLADVPINAHLKQVSW